MTSGAASAAAATWRVPTGREMRRRRLHDLIDDRRRRACRIQYTFPLMKKIKRIPTREESQKEIICWWERMKGTDGKLSTGAAFPWATRSARVPLSISACEIFVFVLPSTACCAGPLNFFFFFFDTMSNRVPFFNVRPRAPSSSTKLPQPLPRGDRERRRQRP